MRSKSRMDGSLISMLETPWFCPMSCFTVCLPFGVTGESRLRCFSSFFSLRWAMYLDMAALNSRPVNLVPLTTSVKVLFSTSSCIGHRLLSTDFAGVALDTKAGPPAAVTGGGPSYRHQNQRPQFRKVQLSLGRHQRVRASVAVAAEILHAEQPIVGALGVGQHTAGGGAVNVPAFQQETDEPPLRHLQLLGGGAQVGAVAQVNKQVVVDGLAFQPGVVCLQRRVLL